MTVVLARLVRLLETRELGMSLAEISRELDAQPSAVLAMIQLLVKKGKLLEVGPDGRICAACEALEDCNLLAVRRKRFVIESRQPSSEVRYGIDT